MLSNFKEFLQELLGEVKALENIANQFLKGFPEKLSNELRQESSNSARSSRNVSKFTPGEIIGERLSWRSIRRNSEKNRKGTSERNVEERYKEF